MKISSAIRRLPLMARFGLAAVGAVMVAAAALAAEPSASSTSQSNSKPMKKFVIMFLPNPTVLSDTEVKKRDGEIHAWAVQNNAARHLEPRIPAATGASVRLGSSGEPIASDTIAPMVALLFFEASD